MAQERDGGKHRLADDIKLKLGQLGIAPRVVVDWGCGSITITRRLAHNFPEAQVFGYDVKDHHSGIPLSDLSNLQFGIIDPFTLAATVANSADFVLLSGVMHHVEPEDEDKLLSDVHGALNEDGILLIHEHCLSPNRFRRKLEKLLLTMVEFGINHGPEDMSCSYNFLTRAMARDILNRNGFEVFDEVDSNGKYVTLPSLNKNTVYWCRKNRLPS
ncbi:MAG: hypothetical protein UV80_C0002G0185 [Candidatus Peregrinibacteria bacterium GW2011_GWF2_43_17]|nr:MAG: hypothetical protein UV80_C0002G0185 [Candidatus Peregrinibacteria bacterium GW2011_GWF2_43_17]KKT20211.1 MAG: hypothetical protein UW03_C0007G0011 [Candidatus Peregrinibacteria bacterium GW2011_GWA2_43_8]